MRSYNVIQCYKGANVCMSSRCICIMYEHKQGLHNYWTKFEWMIGTIENASCYCTIHTGIIVVWNYKTDITEFPFMMEKLPSKKRWRFSISQFFLIYLLNSTMQKIGLQDIIINFLFIIIVIWLFYKQLIE